MEGDRFVVGVEGVGWKVPSSYCGAYPLRGKDSVDCGVTSNVRVW